MRGTQQPEAVRTGLYTSAMTQGRSAGNPGTFAVNSELDEAFMLHAKFQAGAALLSRRLDKLTPERGLMARHRHNGMETVEMRRPVTQRDVARLANVSQTAVSRVMARKGYVADEVRRKIEEAAESLGYRPDPVARSLITGRSNIVAIVVGNVTNPLFPLILAAMTDALRRKGREVLLFNAAHGQDLDELLPDVLTYKVAGIILTTVSLSSRASELCDTAGVPVVLFHRYASAGGAFAVACDNRQGATDATKLLVEAGSRHIAYIGGNEDSSPNQDRKQGYLETMTAAGLVPAGILQGTFSYDWGWQATLDILTAEPRTDAIFCADDAIACGAMDALRYKLHRRVPEDVSVVGFDDVPQAGWAAYDLTTIRQPIDSMIEMTLQLLAEPEAHPRSLFFVRCEPVLRSTVKGT